MQTREKTQQESLGATPAAARGITPRALESRKELREKQVESQSLCPVKQVTSFPEACLLVSRLQSWRLCTWPKHLDSEPLFNPRICLQNIISKKHTLRVKIDTASLFTIAAKHIKNPTQSISCRKLLTTRYKQICFNLKNKVLRHLHGTAKWHCDGAVAGEI